MNSKYEKRLSVDELMARQNTEQTPPRTVTISEEEWTALKQTLMRMEALLTDMEHEHSEMSKTAKRLTQEQKELTAESIRTLTAKYEELVGKASAKAASHIDHHRILDDLLWGLRLAAMALPTVFVLLLSVFMGWLQL